MAELMHKQVVIQRSIERFLDNFKKLGRNNHTPARIKSRMQSLKELWLQFQDGHGALERTIPPAHQESFDYFKEGHFYQTEEVYLSAIDYMAESLEVVEPTTNQRTATGSRMASGAGFSTTHLPAIDLPPFSGKYEEWEQFRDRFATLIIHNQELSNFARMHFLVSALRGTALECIRGLSVTSGSFEAAWNRLKTRFESKRRLLKRHLSALFDLPVIARESAQELQSLIDHFQNNVAALNNLNRSPEELWNDVLVHLIVQKLDSTTRKAWNMRASDDDEPSIFNDLAKFVANRARALEATHDGKDSGSKGSTRSGTITKISSTPAVGAPSATCALCSAKHYVTNCPKFLSRNPIQRREIIRQRNLCFNCLSRNHSVKECVSKYTCRRCQRKHHTLLHNDSDSSSKATERGAVPVVPALTESSTNEISSACVSVSAKSRPHVLLATAWVTVAAKSGRSIVVRALLDPGSEMTLLSEKVAQLLRVQRLRMPTAVSAVAGLNAGTYNHAAAITISPRNEETPTFSTIALLMRTLTEYAPKLHDHSKLNHLADLPWADHDPASQDPIQLIIGSDIYNDLILTGFRRGSFGLPSAQNTALGWVISGPVSRTIATAIVATSDSALASTGKNLNQIKDNLTDSLDQELRQFWELEEIPRNYVLSPEDQQCERHFVETHSRRFDGRYVVRLPFKKGPPIPIGDSYARAERLLDSLHRRLRINLDMLKEYTEFLCEYERSGHMTRVPLPSTAQDPCVYLPHHPVLRESSITTHLRVVFNASSLTTNGSSLNDHLLSGPKLQTELPAVMLRWRSFPYVFAADIKQMYRQILVDNRDVNYQRILWRANPSEPLRAYQLRTVTYGTTSAPFLALRVLKQLTIDEGANYPLAVSVLNANIYVDDVLFGDNDIESARERREQVCTLLSRGGFELRKWASNSNTLLHDIKGERQDSASHRHIQTDDNAKILGLWWDSIADSFRFQGVTCDSIPQTKRAILSTIARLFDPLGFVTPVTIAAKIFMQQLWLLKLDWDNAIPTRELKRWQNIYQSLPALNVLSIARWTGQNSQTSRIELHGFADASSSAYAAVVYMRVTSPSGDVRVTLLAGKSKVAPVKPLSIPRLELSAAVLLARLIQFVRYSTTFKINACVCWTDSTVVLAWLSKHPSHWKTFVANRIATIHSHLPEVSWHYVPSNANPADCASRGILADDLVSHSLWWKGPPWLSDPTANWPSRHQPQSPNFDTTLEIKTVTAHIIHTPEPWALATRYSSWNKLIRITAYVMRFVDKCRPTSNEHPRSAALLDSEYQKAKEFWFKYTQNELFSKEIKALSAHSPISSASTLLSLNPFLDGEGLLRAGGRLQEAAIPFDQKHPVILASHPIVKLLVVNTHLRMLHAGPQLTHATLRQEVWILRARQVIRAVIHRCVRCARERATIPTQLMGSLPKPRISPTTRSFLHCGVDYAGPVSIRASARRGIRAEKAYIALFICLATKAIHLELVGGYSAKSFLDAFSRFCARRGMPEAMYSDNGTNFVGAQREMDDAYRKAVRNPNFQNKIISDRITWHFIPPSAPHFGGLWEAGVRSLKTHLRRVIGTHTLTFEEFSTVLCQIEACLNSRPLAPLTSSLDSCDFLTPGHFLIGANLSVPPEPSVCGMAENRLSRWQLIRQLTERVWKLWRNEYLHSLQQRVKWKTSTPPVRTGQLVLLRNDALPPCKWELGRVVRCHPGSDELVRVVTVRTANSEYTRPIVKLCLLPIDIEEQQKSTTAA